MLDVNLDSLATYEFVFRSIDQDGAYCRYEALFSYEDPETGDAYLFYADEKPNEEGECATYASLCDIEQVREVAARCQPGSIPKKPPLLELADTTSDEQWDLIGRVLDLVDAEED